MRKLMFLLVLVLVSGCSPRVTTETAGISVQPDQPVVYPVARVFKYRGSLQCSGGGIAPEVMQKELVGAGITVGAFSCGHDGLLRAAVCESSDGKINIFHVPAGKVDEARTLGFADLASLPSAAVTACP